jgi:hypothetical protein
MKDWRIESVRSHWNLVKTLTFMTHEIDELEALLLQKERSTENAVPSHQPDTLPEDMVGDINYPNQLSLHNSPQTSSTHPMQDFGSFSGALHANPGSTLSQYQNGHGMEELSIVGQQPTSPHQDVFISTPSIGNQTAGNSVASTYGLDIIWPNWPPHLPGPELLRHL